MRGNARRVRVYAGDDPVTGRRVYRSETVPGTDRAAEKRAQKALTRPRRGGRPARSDVAANPAGVAQRPRQKTPEPDPPSASDAARLLDAAFAMDDDWERWSGSS